MEILARQEVKLVLTSGPSSCLGWNIQSFTGPLNGAGNREALCVAVKGQANLRRVPVQLGKTINDDKTESLLINIDR